MNNKNKSTFFFPDPFLQLHDLILKEVWLSLPEPTPDGEGISDFIFSTTKQLNMLEN